MTEPLGRRVGRFFALLGALFAIVAAVVITQRLSEDALALLVGLACGIGAMLPTLLVGAALWRRQEVRQEQQARRAPQSPSIVVVAPPALPGYGAQRPALDYDAQAWLPRAQQRQFMIVGEEE